MPDELNLWQWRYTDARESGVSPSRLTEEDRDALKDAERVERSLKTRRPTGWMSSFQDSLRKG